MHNEHLKYTVHDPLPWRRLLKWVVVAIAPTCTFPQRVCVLLKAHPRAIRGLHAYYAPCTILLSWQVNAFESWMDIFSY